MLQLSKVAYTILIFPLKVSFFSFLFPLCVCVWGGGGGMCEGAHKFDVMVRWSVS